MMYPPLIKMFKMDCLHATTLIFAVLTVFYGTSAQTVTVSVPASTHPGTIPVGTAIPLTCTVTDGTVPTNNIQWSEVVGTGTIGLFNGDVRFSPEPKYSNFNVTSLSGTESVMTIHNADEEDDGAYRCVIPSDQLATPVTIKVEDRGILTGPILNSIVMNNEDIYEATCDVVGSKPQVSITWYLNSFEQTNGDGKTIVETYPTEPSNPPLSNTRSVFTFPATQENHLQTLECRATGYQLTELESQESRDLDIHTSPFAAGTTVTADYVTEGTDNIRVTCTAENEPSPEMRNYYIFSNGTQIHESMDGVKDVTVSNPVDGTEYSCMAGNYLGNTSISAAVVYDPTRTTPSPTPTAPNTTQPNAADGGSTDPGSVSGLGAGAIAGIAVGAIIFIALIIVVIVVFVVKPDCIGGSGSPNTTTTHKHSTSAVGSSNGNEKEKIRPEAAPRGHSSIKHTTDNPQQAEYAMVDRKPGGRGDSTDARGNGAGQNEQPGMHYADLDLTPSAGHSDRVVPKNEDGVVVYSSILV